MSSADRAVAHIGRVGALAVALGIGGGIAGLIVGKMFGGVQGMMETLAARPATGPVKA